MTTTQKASLDIIIVGAGIAGLWALNRLSNLGYSVALIEANALGYGQTLKSQGIIHGGIKYALGGFLSGSSNAIASMPARWKACLKGVGELDLSAVKTLSDQQFLFSNGDLGSTLTSFFASKALSSRVTSLDAKNYPSLFQHQGYKGQLYALDEIVLDTPSLIKHLAQPYLDRIFKVDVNHGIEVVQAEKQRKITSLKIRHEKESLELKAKRYIFTAGEGNAHLCASLCKPPEMQLRPLQMVWVKLDRPYTFFGHCIEQSMNPRITITSHITKNKEPIWYLGGQLAEDGIHRTTEAQIEASKTELRTLFPWIDQTKFKFASFFVNRAEHKQRDGKRPESVFVETCMNAIVAWPTKLALAPILVDKLVEALDKDTIQSEYAFPFEAFKGFAPPPLAHTPWDA